MKKTLLAILLAVALIVIPVSSALAETSQDVTVTATPYFLSISNDLDNWTLNSITGNGTIQPNNTYYANPLGDQTAPAGASVVDGECRFTVTNDSTIDIDLTVTCENFSGGDANMANSNDGSNGATTYGAYCWYSGMTYANKVVVETLASGSLSMITNFSGASLKWGAEILTQTDAFAGGASSTTTMTITATES